MKKQEAIINLQKAESRVALIRMHLERFARELGDIDESREMLSESEVELLQKYFDFVESFNIPDFPSLKRKD